MTKLQPGLSIPGIHSVFQRNRRLINMRCKITDTERRGVFAFVDVRQHGSNKRRAPLCSHHGVQASVLAAVPEPELELFKAEPFLRFRDRSAADAVEDEFTPDFIFGGELIFPSSFTS